MGLNLMLYDPGFCANVTRARTMVECGVGVELLAAEPPDSCVFADSRCSRHATFDPATFRPPDHRPDWGEGGGGGSEPVQNNFEAQEGDGV